MAAICALVAASVGAEEGGYPLIGSLDRGNLLFHQIEGDVETFHFAQAHARSGAAAPPLLFFRYRLQPGDDIGSVAARLGIGQATLATLNRAATPADFLSKAEVLVANLPGIFVPDARRTEFETELAGPREGSVEGWKAVIIALRGEHVAGRFYLGEVFSPSELVRFHRGFFRGPLLGGRISSRFGVRISPFGAGSTMHTGIDIVAAAGTAVLAAQAGTITEVGSDLRNGNYIVISHARAYETMYAHLATVGVTLRESVESGTIVGTVGDTGRTTGAHLHFEIRFGGAPMDPLMHLPREWSRR